VLAFGNLIIDAAARAVTLDGREVTLSTSEYELLHYLASHAGEVQSRDTLFRELHNREYDGVDRLLDIRVSHLRKKLGDDERAANRIKTVWGQGYLFAPGEW
jgi:DNA-binding response OmpR family regulator